MFVVSIPEMINENTSFYLTKKKLKTDPSAKLKGLLKQDLSWNGKQTSKNNTK